MYSLFKLIFILLSLSAIATAASHNLITVPAGHVAVLKEQTLGWQKPHLQPGNHWIWGGFVPEKYRVYFINLQPNHVLVDFKKGLEYTDYLGLSDTFRVQVSFQLKYQVDEKVVDQLLQNFSENVNDWQEMIVNRARTLVELRFFDFYQTDEDISKLPVSFKNYLQGNGEVTFGSDFAKAFENDGIKLNRLHIEKVYAPNASIYLEQARNVDEIFAARRQAQVQKIFAEAEVYKKEKFDFLDIEKARHFSGLLRENPDVKDYYHIEKLNKLARVIVIEGRTAGVPLEGVLNEKPGQKNPEEITGSPEKVGDKKQAPETVDAAKP